MGVRVVRTHYAGPRPSFPHVQSPTAPAPVHTRPVATDSAAVVESALDRAGEWFASVTAFSPQVNPGSVVGFRSPAVLSEHDLVVQTARFLHGEGIPWHLEVPRGGGRTFAKACSSDSYRPSLREDARCALCWPDDFRGLAQQNPADERVALLAREPPLLRPGAVGQSRRRQQVGGHLRRGEALPRWLLRLRP